jgi:hypothetical protein
LEKTGNRFRQFSGMVCLRYDKRQRLSAGDVVRIPARIPHQVLFEGAHEFTYFVVEVKGY